MAFCALFALQVGNAEFKEKQRRVRFERHFQLASYCVAQVELMTNMCKGRSYNCIAWLEKSFSYSLLMNVATNPLLPSRCTAAVLALVDAMLVSFPCLQKKKRQTAKLGYTYMPVELPPRARPYLPLPPTHFPYYQYPYHSQRYVDRFPQIPNSGTPSLPEKLWVYHDASATAPGAAQTRTTPLSSTPSVRPVKLADLYAFPAFFLPSLCSAVGSPDPVLSHPDHFKFFLLRTLCNHFILSFGGRIIHDEVNFSPKNNNHKDSQPRGPNLTGSCWGKPAVHKRNRASP